MRGSPRTVLIDSLDECPIGYSSERSVDQPPTRLRIYADYKLANQNILLSLSTPQQQSNLENTKRNVLTNRCKNISFMLNDYAPSTFDSALSQSLTQREHFHLPLTQDLPEHLKFFFVVTLHDQHYVFSHHKVGVFVLEGIVAHTDYAIRQIAKNTPTVLP